MKTDLASFAALLLVAVIPAGKQMYLRCNTNLVARPSHRLVLDHSQYAKMEGGKAWSILSCEWRQCLQREGRSPIERMSLRPYLVASAPSAEVLNIRKANKVPTPGSKWRMHVQNAFFWSETPSHLCLSLMSLCDKMDQAFPLCFCMLQAIKNLMGGMPGNKANVTPHGPCLLHKDIAAL